MRSKTILRGHEFLYPKWKIVAYSEYSRDGVPRMAEIVLPETIEEQHLYLNIPEIGEEAA